ncbi:MAG: sulfatase-like hydrolase/transferase, partial [Acidimicrobiales bacterium]
MTAPDVVIIITDEERAAPTYEPAELRAWRETRLKGRRWFTDHGVDFARHYVAATACVPSRPSLLTGQYPDLHGVTQTDGLAKQADDSRMRWLRPGEVPTIGHWFRAAGYDTHYDGKWHVSHADIMVDGVPLPTNTADGAVIADNVERYRRADPLDPYGFTGWIGPEPHGGRLRDCGYVRDPLIAARVVAWLADRYARRRAGDADALRPFLLVVGFVNPHDIVLWPLWARRGLPFEARPDDPPPIPPSPTDHEDLADKPAAQLAFRGAYPSAYGPPVMVRRAYRRDDEYRWLYHRLHLEVDTPIDQVRLAVTSGGSGDAVLALTSDHGDLLGAHGGLHQKWFNLYDEAVRVPLQIVRIGEHPTSPATVTDAVTSHVDLLPTLLGLAGIDAPSARRELEADHSEVHPLPGRDLSELVHRPSAVLEGGAYVMSRDNILEGDGIANA